MLKPCEEARTVDWILQCTERGMPHTAEELKQAACEVRAERQDESTPRFVNGFPKQNWIDSFISRHPQVTFRKPEKITRASANVSKGRITSYFESVEKFFVNHNLLVARERPEAFLNLDETALEITNDSKRII